MPEIQTLWDQLLTRENLWLAWRRAAKGKRRRMNVARFALDAERELSDLYRQLQERCYRPGRYRHFTVHDGKPRSISAAPFRDRVVHHALIANRRATFLRPCFYPIAGLVEKVKGTHAAVRDISEVGTAVCVRLEDGCCSVLCEHRSATIDDQNQ